MVDTVGRLFLAVPLPPEVRFALADRLDELRLPGKPVPPENWHITLRFLDVVDQVTYERFLSGLEQPSETSFNMGIDGFGSFPNSAKATVLWAGVGTGANQLASLNEQAEEASVSAGLLPEERPFHPHLTLSRLRPPVDVRHLMGEEVTFGWRCQTLIVYRSHLGRGKARYEPLDSIDLVG